jgi:hypothetical protein
MKPSNEIPLKEVWFLNPVRLFKNSMINLNRDHLYPGEKECPEIIAKLSLFLVAGKWIEIRGRMDNPEALCVPLSNVRAWTFLPE